MKIIFDNGIEVECTVEEFKELYNSGYFNNKQKSTTDNDDDINWDKLIRQMPKIQPGVEPYKPDPFRDNVVLLYGCNIPNDGIRYLDKYLDNTPIAGTSSDSLSPSQFKTLNDIVGNKTDEQKGEISNF